MFEILKIFWMLLAIRPGLANARESSSFVPHVSSESGEPSCAQGHTYCVKVEDYPRDIILQLLKSAPQELTSIFLDNAKGQNIREFPLNHGNTSVTMRKRDEQLCQSVIRIIRPLAARNEKNEWRYIVNVQQHAQVVEIEYCKNGAHKCSVQTTKEEHAVCEQKMMARQLLALHPSGSKLTFHNAMLPSCCQCTLYEVPRALL